MCIIKREKTCLKIRIGPVSGDLQIKITRIVDINDSSYSSYPTLIEHTSSLNCKKIKNKIKIFIPEFSAIVKIRIKIVLQL